MASREAASPTGFTIPLLRASRQAVLSNGSLSSALAVANSQNYAYLAQVGFGGQNISVILDTGSADLWVVSSDCENVECRGVAAYNQTSSLSRTNTAFKLDYLMGSVSGTIAFETVSLGPYRISHQVFALANSTVGLGMSSIGNSGILGLALPADASIPSTSGQPLLKNLLSYFPEDRRYFTVKLTRGALNSSFTVGQLDPMFANSTDKFNWNLVSLSMGSVYDYWKLPLRGITINGSSLAMLSDSKIRGSTLPIAVLDTGTTLILGPTSDVAYFWKSVGGAKQDDTGQWQVRCNRGVVVKLVLGDDNANEYALDPQDVSWMDGGKEGEWCMGGIQANDHVNAGDWLLGDVFLRNVYVAHQIETSTGPPRLGLLSTTDVDTAMASFVSSRGIDDTPVGTEVIGNILRSHPHPNASVVYGTSIGAGFVIGTVVTLFFLFRQAKNVQKREK